MKEIKFKAWDKKIQQFIDAKEIVINDGKIFRNWQDFEDYIPDEDTIELVWTTGLADKNCIEVYEGDIISAYFDAINGIYLTTYTVKYDEFHALYPFTDFAYYESPMHFTVIGNRYENPEMVRWGN